MDEERRTVPYGWISLFALLALIAYIGLSRHVEPPNAPPALYDPIAGTSTDRAASADIAAGIRAMTSPVDANRIVQHFTVSGNGITVVVDRAAYDALAPADQGALFAAISDLWRRTYKKQHGAFDHSISVDLMDAKNNVVHHNLIDPE